MAYMLNILIFPMQKCTWFLLVLSPLGCDSFWHWCCSSHWYH